MPAINRSMEQPLDLGPAVGAEPGLAEQLVQPPPDGQDQAQQEEASGNVVVEVVCRGIRGVLNATARQVIMAANASPALNAYDSAHSHPSQLSFISK